MNVEREQLSETKVKLSFKAEASELNASKLKSLKKLSGEVKVPGFRPGKAPMSMVEKYLPSSTLQSDFLDEAINKVYVDGIQQENLRPVAQPNINVTKFVPFTTLEFSAEVEVIGDVKLPDYKKLSFTQKKAIVTAKDVQGVLDNLADRAAVKKDVKRAAKNGDEVTIDFKGRDAKTQESIEGTDGKDYPLVIGSGSFIPGFEEKLIGLKPDGEITFDIVFPADYNVEALKSKKVTFEVKVLSIKELTKPTLNDAFAATVGPFKSIEDLKGDIKKQLVAEQERDNKRALENEIIEKIAEKTTVEIPVALIEEEIDRMEAEERQNLVYRGQTWQEHLDAEGVTEDDHRERQREGASLRVKAGLVLSEVANKEHVTVSPNELDVRIELLKGQYPDTSMHAELEKPDSRRDILSRLLTEKTLDKLKTLVTIS
jgi:trigger factor